MKYAAIVFGMVLTLSVLVPVPSAARVRDHLATGTVMAVHPKALNLTVHERSKGNVVINVPVTASIQRGEEMLLLNQLQRGWRVAVRYQESGTALIATQVKVFPPETARHRR